jgi:hypothetical protein
MRGLKTWAEMHMDDVLANRATYDTHAQGHVSDAALAR